ncbi:hypothetical protein B1J92_K07073g [Nakaseomyces glabratus]|nr:hypothetical protein B1J91_K07073g [Nakaseomyces glabratus]OXB46908.1 hypothetical protein B1J92_K07073g [Nakaseomyces glabratus]
MRASKFYDLPGAHRPSPRDSVNESSSLIGEFQRRTSTSSYNYYSTPSGKAHKVSSRYDPDNPNKDKLGTFDGVFIPTALNVLSILMFLRFGFILGQLGILSTLGLLVLSYSINLLTTLSISAISTNGTVRGGGAYYMISRSLGPEFGGSIGLVFFLGQVFNSGMNAVGLVEPLLYNFGANKNLSDNLSAGVIWPLLPQGEVYSFIYATTILFICLMVALVGSQTVSRAGNILFFILFASIISIPISLLFKLPFTEGFVKYTGPSWKTFKNNLFPHFTKGAAGSLLKGKENFSDIFGVFFPATAGIFAGAGMSSELRKPSKSIPKGTLWGLLFTIICYSVVVMSMGCSIPRNTLYKELQVIQSVSVVQWLIFSGELATSLFSIIVGMVGAAYILVAIAKDSIFPGLKVFNKHPLSALLFTWFSTQLCLFLDVNKIANFITMTFLMTFAVMNLACFLLSISSAPNFRPSFKYFNRYTALFGTISSVIAMLIVDGLSASELISAMTILFLLIHYFCPPKSWGDVSQNLIYHQVRKYLLRLKQDNIKYWRPQILLFVDDPRSSWNLILFCNHLKKGGLYILGHVTVVNNFQKQLDNIKKQQKAWMKIRDITKIKAFVQIGTGPSLNWGVRNVFLGSGLGGMKPNITVLGAYYLKNYKNKGPESGSASLSQSRISMNSLKAIKSQKMIDAKMNLPTALPTDAYENKVKVTPTQWVQMIEDLSLMQSNIAIAHGFRDLDIPQRDGIKQASKRVIDLYPIQMCGKLESDGNRPSLVSTNLDTYTLILQLGAILVTVPDWKETHILRVILFAENVNTVKNDIENMQKLLDVLRIQAEVIAVTLDQFRVYNTIVHGEPSAFEYVNRVLEDDDWWNDLVDARRTLNPKRRFSTADGGITGNKTIKTEKYKVAGLQKLGVNLKLSSSVPNQQIISPYESEISDTESTMTSKPTSTSTLTLNGLFRNQNGIYHKNDRRVMSHNLDSSSGKKTLPVFSTGKLPKTKVLEDGIGDKPTLIPVIDTNDPNERQSRKQDLPELSPLNSNESLVKLMENIKFDDLPSRAQHLILNDVMINLSKHSRLLFSTLPLPQLGTHKDETASMEYIENLDIWLDGLPPTMLINAQMMTVTTAL